VAAPARDFCQDVFCTNFNQNFVQNYLLTFSQKSTIIKLQKERGNKMTTLEILSYVFVGTFVGNILYDFLKKVLDK